MGRHGNYDFRQIVPRLGGQREAFEELCCQLARRTLARDADFVRLHGAGGDGGVECFADLPDGSRTGWQAKYVFRVDSLITQATASLTTALRIHPQLTRFTLCFPFDLTGRTGRRGRSGKEKLDDWRTTHQDEAAAQGRQLVIEVWPASALRSHLINLDRAGGIRAFFFDETILTDEWFWNHLTSVKTIAGPRYTPELNVETDLWKWFAAFARGEAWPLALKEKVGLCGRRWKSFASVLSRTSPESGIPEWPDESQEQAEHLCTEMTNTIEKCSALSKTEDVEEYSRCTASIDELLVALRSVESHLVETLDAKHGPGKADSPGFRQFMAEYMCSFPMAHLDNAREVISALSDLRDWLASPEGVLAFSRVFVLTGAAGAGKTHGVCDTAKSRLRNGHLTCVVFGHQFRGEPDPWTRVLESLGLPVALGKDGLLDALNSAAEASGFLLVVCIDAINETRPLRYWRDHLAAFAQAIQGRPHLRLCITCRTPFRRYCLPEGLSVPVIEHRGFVGAERSACRAFFQYYSLKPPISPILQPEFSNPLYLKLVCETLLARGLDRFPSGWHGLMPTIRGFLEEKERQFSDEYETSVNAQIIGGSLRAIARMIADSGGSSLHWSQAQRIVCEARPQSRNLPVLEWLVRSDLLIEDAP